jgi:hypothetical protein
MSNYNALSIITAAALLGSVGPSIGRAVVTDEEFAAVKAELDAIKQKQDANWLTDERTQQIKAIVQDVLADAKSRGEFSDGPTVGYNNGFFIQTPDQNFKLVVGGLLQVRYEYASHYVNNAQYGAKPPLAQGDSENSSGFDIRRARITFSGNAFSPNLFYRFEGDFYGSSTGAFTVTDAFVGYIFNDQVKLRAGAFKVPFTKSQEEYDMNLELERPEVELPFDAQRALGVSLFGDIIKDRLGYEVNANDGSKTNTLRYVDTYSNVTTISTTSTPGYNLDNRLAFYGRVQYAGAGKIIDFYEGGEADLRKDNSEFIWLLGAAAGYESQNSSAAAFPQNTASILGLGSNDSPGFTKAYVLNGDLYRATADWSAKWQGWSFNTAGYFQQVNANPYAGSVIAGLPYTTNKASFFQQAYYAQAGYMIVPRTFELLGRVSYLLDEGDPNNASYYTLAGEYYLYGNNAKILADINYTPKAAYTDSSTLQIANTRQVVFRVQLQLKF